MPPKYPANASQAPAKPPKPQVDTNGAGVASNPLAGLPCLPPDLRAFLRNRSVTEIAELLQLGKGTASRIKRGIYPHQPTKLLKRWEAVRATGVVPVGTWALRRVMADATAHEAVLRREHLPGIKRALARAAETEAALRALVEANPGCFIRPRTQVFAGIKVGYAKGKGALSFDDADSVVARIKKHLPEQADVLIRTKEAPVKEALAQLSAAELKKIGVTLSEAGDQTVVRPVDSEVDKMVDALLKAATGEEGEA